MLNARLVRIPARALLLLAAGLLLLPPATQAQDNSQGRYRPEGRQIGVATGREFGERVYEVRTYEANPGAAEFASAMVFYPLTLSFDRPNGAIAFSPGFRAAADNYEWWGPTLASLGYNVFILNTNEPTDGLAARAAALAALVDFIQAENSNPESPVHNKIDTEKIALMGHSMGGGAALAAAEQLGDAVGAVIPLALYCCEPGAAFEGDFSAMTAPALVIASAEDQVAPPADHARLLYDSLGAETRVYMEFAAGDHMFPANGGPEHDTMGRMTLAFLKAYLDGVEELAPRLASPAAEYADKFSTYLAQQNGAPGASPRPGARTREPAPK